VTDMKPAGFKWWVAMFLVLATGVIGFGCTAARNARDIPANGEREAGGDLDLLNDLPDSAVDVDSADRPHDVIELRLADESGEADGCDLGLFPDQDQGGDLCVPSCSEKQCGDDGCAGVCGECLDGQVCLDHLCACKPEDHLGCCADDVCWFDGCGSQGEVATHCQAGCSEGECLACLPDCAGKECGDDGCGASCGACDAGSSCQAGDCTCINPPTTIWDKTYGGDGFDTFRAVTLVADGGLAVAGRRAPDGSSYPDLWLVSMDSEGNPLWDSSFGGDKADGAYGMTILPDGGFALAGRTESSQDDQMDYGGAWLVRTDSQGSLLWDKTYGGGAFGAVAALSDGGFALGGGKKPNSMQANQFWLVRTDAGGNELWNKTYGGNDYDSSSALAALPDGGFVLAGATESKGAGMTDSWLVRTDDQGNLLWDKTYGGAKFDRSWALARLPDGGFALAGATMSKGSGGRDFWLVRTDSEGNLLWDKTYGGIHSDVAMSVSELPDGGFLLAGWTGVEGVDSFDLWLVRTDGDGNALWGGTYGGGVDGPNFYVSVVLLEDGGLVVGSTTEVDDAGDLDLRLTRLGPECSP